MQAQPISRAFRTAAARIIACWDYMDGSRADRVRRRRRCRVVRHGPNDRARDSNVRRARPIDAAGMHILAAREPMTPRPIRADCRASPSIPAPRRSLDALRAPAPLAEAGERY